MAYTIQLPVGLGVASVPNLSITKNLVLVGANGSGKTRLGAWLETALNPQIVHRISAQKALNIPAHATLRNLDEAQEHLLYGGTTQIGAERELKNYNRWKHNPITNLLDDYGLLLSLLFAKSAERDRIHALQTRAAQAYVPVEDAPIDKIVKIWSTLMPHRSIAFIDGKVMVSKQGVPDYHGREMSDGERVILYLMGQCLCAPIGSIIIIDEPEIHIHKSLVSKLWNVLEEHCQDKQLIYMTHDLEFASSRGDATKLWVKSYGGNNTWELDFVPDDDELPESLVLEIIGNRKNIIFCEGERGSLDSMVYQLVYPDHHIIPRGGGGKVIEATRAFRNNGALHHVQAFGITDSDYKEAEEKASLLTAGIHTLPVAEIENMFCIEPILRIVAIHNGYNADAKVKEVIDFLVNCLQAEFHVQVSSMAEKKIEYMLGAFSKKDNNEQGLLDALSETTARIDIPDIYAKSHAIFQEAIDSRDLTKLLLIYNRKSLQDRISPIFGLAKGEYGKLLIRLLKGPRKQEIIDALKLYLPTF